MMMKLRRKWNSIRNYPCFIAQTKPTFDLTPRGLPFHHVGSVSLRSMKNFKYLFSIKLTIDLSIIAQLQHAIRIGEREKFLSDIQALRNPFIQAECGFVVVVVIL